MPTDNQLSPQFHTRACLTVYLATHDPQCPCNNYIVDTLLYVAALSTIVAGSITPGQRDAAEGYGCAYECLYTSWGENVAPWSLIPHITVGG